MTIKTRIVKLEKLSATNEQEPFIIGWEGADFHLLTADEVQENRNTGKFMFWRG